MANNCKIVQRAHGGQLHRSPYFRQRGSGAHGGTYRQRGFGRTGLLPANQSGKGLSGIFRTIKRFFFPMVKKVVNTVAKKGFENTKQFVTSPKVRNIAKKAAVHVVSEGAKDLIDGKSVKDSAKNLVDGAKHYLNNTLDESTKTEPAAVKRKATTANHVPRKKIKVSSKKMKQLRQGSIFERIK